MSFLLVRLYEMFFDSTTKRLAVFFFPPSFLVRSPKFAPMGRCGDVPFFHAPSPFRRRGPHLRGVNSTTRKPGGRCLVRARGWHGCAPSCPHSALWIRRGAGRRATGEQTSRAPPVGASPAGL